MFNNRIHPGAVAGVLVALSGVAAYLHWPEDKQPPLATPSNTRTFVNPHDQALGLRIVRVETVAGDEPGFADGPLWQARFCGPTALALEPDGSLLVCDSRNHRLRRIGADRGVTTVAGGGEPEGPGGRADGPAAEARFRYPSGVAAAADGTLYLSDTGNHRICVLRGGQVRTLAGSVQGRADGKGPAARFDSPAALTLSRGVLWVADMGNRRIRRVDPSGAVTTPAQVPLEVRQTLGDCETDHRPETLVSSTSLSTGKIDLVRTRQRTAGRSFADNRALAAALDLHPAMAPRVYADPQSHGIFFDRVKDTQVLLAGSVARVAAESPRSVDGSGYEARFAAPCALVFAGDGTAYVSEYEGNRIRRLVLSPALLAELASAPAQTMYLD